MLRLVLYAIVAFAAAGIGSYLWLVRAPLEQLEQAKDRHFELREEYIRRQKFRINLPLYRAQIPVMRDLDKALRIGLPDFDGIAAGRHDLEQAIREAAQEKKLASRIEFATGDWSSREFYYFRPFTVRVSGEFRPVVEFLQSVTAGSVQLRTAKTVSLRPVAGRDEVELSLEALALRYRAEEPK